MHHYHAPYKVTYLHKNCSSTRFFETTTPDNMTQAKDFGQLVVLGFDVTVFTPAPYQRRSLRRPSMESSSCGWLRT